MPESDPLTRPAPVPLRLPEGATLSLRVLLSRALETAASQAADTAADPALPSAMAEGMRRVRDTLRAASIETLVPRGDGRTPRCRRCGIDCAQCAPPAATSSTLPAELSAEARARVTRNAARAVGHPEGHDCASCVSARQFGVGIESAIAAAPDTDGMAHLYDCCPAAPTQPHTDDCTAGRS